MKTGETTGRVRQRAQHGNAIMEFAIVIFPFFALIFGIMSVTYMVFLQGVIQSSVRAGCRWAITFNRGTYDGINCASTQDSCIKAVVEDNALGFLSGANSQYIVINYYPPFRLGTAISSSDTFPLKDPNNNYPNVTYYNQTNNVIQVTVTGYPAMWLAPFPGYLNQRTFNLYASASDVLEGYGVDTSGDGNNGQVYQSPPTAGPPY
ncbi:MAG: TadE family protein [Bryobacteraceae bacterium]|jgi:hypothetical protein